MMIFRGKCSEIDETISLICDSKNTNFLLNFLMFFFPNVK